MTNREWTGDPLEGNTPNTENSHLYCVGWDTGYEREQRVEELQLEVDEANSSKSSETEERGRRHAQMRDKDRIF